MKNYMRFEYEFRPHILGLGRGEWIWRLKAANNEIIASGESYPEKRNCLHAIELVKGTSRSTPVEEVEN